MQESSVDVRGYVVSSEFDLYMRSVAALADPCIVCKGTMEKVGGRFFQELRGKCINFFYKN